MKQFEQTLLFLLIVFDKIGKWNVNVFQDIEGHVLTIKIMSFCKPY